jgi:hypothetical protein
VSWSFYLLLVPTVAYIAASVSYGVQGNWPLSIVYLGYSIGNVGLLWLDRVMAR